LKIKTNPIEVLGYNLCVWRVPQMSGKEKGKGEEVLKKEISSNFFLLAFFFFPLLLLLQFF